MFGYVRPNKSEMLVKEYAQYKASYCQLCKALGEEYGFAARFALSYDCTFYALLALSVAGSKVEECRGRCVCNPLKRCTYLPSAGEEYEKAAALCVLLTYHKLRDDLTDQGFFQSLGSRLLMPLARRKAGKAGGKYPAMAEAVERAMEEQSRAEAAGAGVDQCAEPTASLLGTLFADLAGAEDRQRPVLERFGYFLGRWVYLMDAADDLREDLKDGAFNPFIKRLGLEGKTELTPAEREAAELRCNEVLNATAAQLALAANLLELRNFGPIIQNVAEKGLAEIQREILFLHVKEKPRRELEKV